MVPQSIPTNIDWMLETINSQLCLSFEDYLISLCYSSLLLFDVGMSY